jgi:sodium-dependent phosphate cotransporter
MKSSRARERLLVASRWLRLALFLFLFLLSIDLMGVSLNMLGKDVAERIVGLTSNPVAGLFIGILATSIVQSSSATTSTVVTMTAAGALSVRNAIPIVMGANIGTTVTNILVSLVHVTRKDEFNRAFGGAIVHDVFNLLAVAVFLPLEMATHFIQRSAERVTGALDSAGGLKVASPVKLVVRPISDALKHLLTDGAGLAQRVGGALLLVLAAVLLFLSLYLIVRLIRSLVLGTLESFFNKQLFVNAGFFFAIGLVITAIVQSSSVTTSLVVPLIGAGVLTVERVYPYMLGANIGTTVTGLLASLAAMATGGASTGVTVALSHLFFNVCGAGVFYPLRFIPISLAKTFGERAANSRLFALSYLLVVFFLLPFMVLLLQKHVPAR